MSSEISLDYADVLKAYQSKSAELLTQLITAEAKLNASAGVILSLKEEIENLKLENENLKKNTIKSRKSSTISDNVDYN